MVYGRASPGMAFEIKSVSSTQPHTRECDWPNGTSQYTLQRFTWFYGSPNMQDRNESWDLLRNLSNAEELPWFICGYFNEMMYGHEKKVGLPKEERCMDAFHTVLADCHLVDMGYTGNWFTWKRGNLLEMNIQDAWIRELLMSIGCLYF
ncbi:hypothetical protein J1N35_005826 [Gossypium stocksii]|uniref:Endonuclease/exonuclease/phosphatase domain-containing protein n=1 Tax=Gossypium stocksii TaxID=47602 RepID=A0A9D3WEJ2_9ROSI|nr:hypothetical protein J1N35_005826 [Gossypium stocksii]